MRALSSKPVVHCAEDVARKILDTYLEPDKSFVELREMAIDGTIDLLRGFSDACHDEFEEMGPDNFELCQPRAGHSAASSDRANGSSSLSQTSTSASMS